MIKVILGAVAESNSVKLVGSSTAGAWFVQAIGWAESNIVQMGIYAGFIYTVTMIFALVFKEYRESRAAKADLVLKELEIQKKRKELKETL